MNTAQKKVDNWKESQHAPPSWKKSIASKWNKRVWEEYEKFVEMTKSYTTRLVTSTSDKIDEFDWEYVQFLLNEGRWPLLESELRRHRKLNRELAALVEAHSDWELAD
jgi:hypothetical protein